jgi:dipeptidyl aminopeptidase/acylaminoacyl peptidase
MSTEFEFRGIVFILSRPTRTVVFLLAVVCAAAVNNMQAQRSSLEAILDSLYAMRGFTEVAISPDGQRVAWVEGRHIHVVRLPGETPSRITAGGTDEQDVAWSPDSRELVFLSNAELSNHSAVDPVQLYIAFAEGGPSRRLTNLNGTLAAPRWSSDGKAVALLFTQNSPRSRGPLEPMTPPSGVIGKKVYEQRLVTIDVASGRMRWVSPPNLYVYEYDWSPDGKEFVATAAPGEGDAHWYIAQIYVFDRESGEARSIYKPPLQIGVPRWSPDGKHIAFIGGLMSDEGSIGGDVFLIPATGGKSRNLTPGLKASPSWLRWLPGGQRILLLESFDGASALATLKVASGHVTPLWSGPETLSRGASNFSLSLAQDSKTGALVRESFSKPPEVWAGRVGDWKQVTHVNRGLEASWGKVESIHWRNEGYTIQGWLCYPREYDPARRYPLVVQVHGGPASIARPRWPRAFFNVTPLSQEGYFVLSPNPRGSLGEGEDFTRANIRDFGYGDLRDILAGANYVVKHFPVDSNRVGITGWSYGGYMTMWAVTQTSRFRAAVVGAGIADWRSYYGENDIDEWLIPYFGASVYDNPAIYARSSPINFITKVKTPTLMLVGDRDGECPAPQSFEFWHALRDLGVPNRFVVYPNEGHNIYKPQHQRDIFRRTVEWFNDYLKQRPTT